MKTKTPPKPTAPNEKAYFAEAISWETDRLLATQRSERNAWFVAIAAGSLSLCMGVAIMLMLPLKRIEPYVVRVDNTTGIVDVVNTLRTDTNDYSEAVTKYFITKYVRGRESYNYDLVDSTFDEVMLLSGPAQARQYGDYILPRNPASPVNKLAKRGTIEIKIKSVSFLKKDVASVRYLRIDRADGSVQRQTDWIATLSFVYSRAKAVETVREVNPLGFQVTEYRVDPEVIQNGIAPPPDSSLPVSAGKP